ncbi:RNase HII [Lachnospiraceae bacterium RM5]|nr:RNase HII [Lachnospiraceae bacterium RM5]
MENKPKSIKEIKELFENSDIYGYRKIIESLNDDDRTGVINLKNKYLSKIEKYNNELLRLKKMREYENKYNDCEFICGIDEVGRGPLAGPVVTGAVILPKNVDILYLNDSKKLSKKRREELSEEIKEKALYYSTALVDEKVIDEINILQSTYKAMRMAIENLGIKPDLLLVDAVTIPDVDIKQVPIIKGDAKSVSIAAASIIAKVERDRMMEEYDKVYPEYQFASNMGYGSKAHIEAIKKYGPCEIHRRTFIKNFI